MKYHGDIPVEHLELVKELEDLESWFYEHGIDVPFLAVAKGMTCMAHDYYTIHMEEEGDRLFRTAEKYFPGYFENAVYDHIKKDKDFALLIAQMHQTEGLKMLYSLGFKSE